MHALDCICEASRGEQLHDALFLENVVPAVSPYVARECQVLCAAGLCSRMVLGKLLLKLTDVLVEGWKIGEKYHGGEDERQSKKTAAEGGAATSEVGDAAERRHDYVNVMIMIMTYNVNDI